MNIEVKRLWVVPDNAEHRSTTTGTISLDGRQICFSLEPTKYMIVGDTYPVKLLWSPRFNRNTPHILNVPGRSEIEMHGGNYAEDSEGCVLCAMNKLDDYTIAESKQATDLIESRLSQAESAGEVNTVTIQ